MDDQATTAAETTEATPTMEETMSAAYDASMDEGPVEEVAEEVVETEETEAQAEVESDEIEEGEASQEETEEAQAETEAPNSWREDAKAIFKDLPEEAQAEILKREADFEKGIAKHAEKAKQADDFLTAAAPYTAMIAAEGGTPAKAFESLLQTAAIFRVGSPQQKADTVRQLIQQFGVDVNLVSPQDEGTATYQDPDLAALKAEIADLKGQLTTQQATEQNQKIQTANQQIEEFAQAEGHEHFDKVRTQMGVLIQSGQAKGLQDAYDQSLWLVPELREEMLAKQKKAEEDKKTAETKKAVKKAKKAAGTNLKSKGGTGNKPVKKKSIEETMSDAFDRANAA
jgi:hypothetical protein